MLFLVISCPFFDHPLVPSFLHPLRASQHDGFWRTKHLRLLLLPPLAHERYRASDGLKDPRVRAKGDLLPHHWLFG
jgi:hypothetical protein